MWEVSLIILRKLQCCIPDPNASSTLGFIQFILKRITECYQNGFRLLSTIASMTLTLWFMRCLIAEEILPGRGNV